MTNTLARAHGLRPQPGHAALPAVRWVVAGWRLQPHGCRGRVCGAARRAPARVCHCEPRLVVVAGPRAQTSQILRSGPGGPVCMDTACEVTANPAPVPRRTQRERLRPAQDPGCGPSSSGGAGLPAGQAGPPHGRSWVLCCWTPVCRRRGGVLGRRGRPRNHSANPMLVSQQLSQKSRHPGM